MTLRPSTDHGGVFAALIAAAVDGIVVVDAKGIILIFNDASERIFGYPRSEAIGRDLSILMPKAFAVEHADHVSRYLSSGEGRIIGIGREIVGRRKDGSVFPIHLSVGDGVVDGQHVFVGVIRDISTRKAQQRRIETLQHALRQATRASAMERLTEAIAEEISEPLTAALECTRAALGALHALEGDAADNVRAAIGKIIEQAVRTGGVIQSLKKFAQGRFGERTHVDINELVAEAIAFGVTGLGEGRIQTDLADDLPKVVADRAQLAQVVIHLLLNAADAVSGVPQPELRVSTRLEGGEIRVKVVDNGPGLSGDAHRNLFRPFVTTKPTGAGMGLNICRTIAEAHGGTLAAESLPQGGMTFVFSLPVDHASHS